MEVSAAIVEHDNKENIPPKSAERLNPKPAKDKFCRRKIVRKPLRDITHLFCNSVQSNNRVPFPLFHIPSVLPPAASLNTRKRKATEANEDEVGAKKIDSLCKNSSKMLRVHFR